MKKKIFVLLFTIMFGWCSTLMMPASTVSAADGGCEHMLFGIFKPWYAGLPMGDNCSLQLDSTGEDGSGLASFVWQIVLNVLFDLMAAASIVAVGFVIYGGYLFITSEGDPGKLCPLLLHLRTRPENQRMARHKGHNFKDLRRQFQGNLPACFRHGI